MSVKWLHKARLKCINYKEYTVDCIIEYSKMYKSMHDIVKYEIANYRRELFYQIL